MNCTSQLVSLLDVLVKLATLVIATCAFVVSFVTLRRQAERDRRSHLPRLSVNDTEVQGKENALELTNNGLGPAVITSYRTFIDGVEVHKTPGSKKRFEQAIQNALLTGQGVSVSEMHVTTDMLPAESSMMLLSVKVAKDSDTLPKLPVFSWEIKYESLMGEQFTFVWPPKE